MDVSFQEKLCLLLSPSLTPHRSGGDLHNSSGPAVKEPEPSLQRVRPDHRWLLLEIYMMEMGKARKTFPRGWLPRESNVIVTIGEVERCWSLCPWVCEEIVCECSEKPGDPLLHQSKIISSRISWLHSSLWPYPVSSYLTPPPPFPEAKGVWNGVKTLRSKLNQFLDLTLLKNSPNRKLLWPQPATGGRQRDLGMGKISGKTQISQHLTPNTDGPKLDL